MRRFKEKVVVITGADSTIGHATAMRFAEEGASIVAVGLNQVALESTVEQLPLDKTWIHVDSHLTVTCDINEPSQLTAMVEHVYQKYEHIDVLVNLSSSFEVCQTILPEIVKSKGNIVNVTPLSGLDDDWNMAMYDEKIAKVTKITQTLAMGNGLDGVRVNAVVPSTTLTDVRSNDPQSNDKVQRFLQRSPLGKLANAEDIAAAISFLASEDADMITGVTLPVDGGVGMASMQNDTL